MLDLLPAEPVDPGRHRRVRGEHRAGAHHLQGGVEAQPAGHQFADPLQAEEAGVALVGVVDLGVRCPRQTGVDAQGAHPADAEQHLLLQPVLPAATVEPVGDHPRGVVVGLHVGVQQQQRHPADLRLPDVRRQGAPAGQADLDHGRHAVRLAQQRDRQLVRVEHRVGLLLPALAGERLLEVPVLVEQADPDDRHREVAGRLQVVAGQDAQAAGVLRQHCGDPELRGEVGDAARDGPLQALVPAGLGQVGLEVGSGGAHALDERRVGGQGVELLRRQGPQQRDRVVA